jgi:hypothetical protein
MPLDQRLDCWSRSLAVARRAETRSGFISPVCSRFHPLPEWVVPRIREELEDYATSIRRSDS